LLCFTHYKLGILPHVHLLYILSLCTCYNISIATSLTRRVLQNASKIRVLSSVAFFAIMKHLNNFWIYSMLVTLNKQEHFFFSYSVQCTCLWENFSYIYSKTCIKKSPLGKQKTGTVNSEINAFIYYCDLRKLNQPGFPFLINAKLKVQNDTNASKYEF
jgi:hypothetical protein